MIVHKNQEDKRHNLWQSIKSKVCISDFEQLSLAKLGL